MIDRGSHPFTARTMIAVAGGKAIAVGSTMGGVYLVSLEDGKVVPEMRGRIEGTPPGLTWARSAGLGGEINK